MQPVTGGFVGLVSSALQFSLCLWKLACLGAFCVPAGMCRAYAQIWSESMSDPVQDQSSHHSRSVRDDKMQAVTSGSPAAAFVKHHLCYLSHHTVSLVCQNAAHIFILCLFLLRSAEGWTLNQLENINACKQKAERDGEMKNVRASRLWVFTYSVMWIHAEIVFALPNKRRSEVASYRKELLWMGRKLLSANRSSLFVELAERQLAMWLLCVWKELVACNSNGIWSFLISLRWRGFFLSCQVNVSLFRRCMWMNSWLLSFVISFLVGDSNCAFWRAP